MSRTRILPILPLLFAATAWLAISPQAAAQDGDFYADARVARLADVSGDVSMAAAGTDQWGEAYRNRPLVAGDRLLTGPRGRAAMQLGDAAVRIDNDSALDFLSLDASLVQIELSRGTLNLRVHEMYGDQIYEVDTPTLAFVAEEPGSYRVDVAPGGYGAMVTVFDGRGTVYGIDGESRRVYAGRSYRFDDSRLVRVDVDDIPRGDNFDRYGETLDRRYANSASSRYVAGNVIGYRDLDRYGTWQASVSYGSIWYPRNVDSGWRPYRDGRWAWVQPWGWTWVDNAPWGFAPFHYGRWAYVGHRWGWIPGPRHHRAVYAPALVGFLGGSNWSLSIGLGNIRPVGWFPLGPRDLYLPPYHVDRNYFRRVNITNVRVVNNTVINNFYDDYRNDRGIERRHYAYRDNPRAVTVVSRDVFTSASPVGRSAQVLTERALSKVSVARSPQIAPRIASLGVSPRGRPPALASKAFDSKVVTRHTPRARPVAFAERQPVIAGQDGKPLTAVQRRGLRATAPTSARNAPRGQPVTVTRAPSTAKTTTPGPRRPVAKSAVSTPRGAPGISRDTPRASATHSAKSRMVAAPRTTRSARQSAGIPRSRSVQSAPRARTTTADDASRRSGPTRMVRAPVSRTRSHIAPVDDSMIPRAKPIVRTTPSRTERVQTPRATPRAHSAPRVIQQRAPTRATPRASNRAPVSRGTPRSAPAPAAQRQRSVQRPSVSRSPRSVQRPSRQVATPAPRHVTRQPAAAPTRSHAAPSRVSSANRAATNKPASKADTAHPRGAPQSRRRGSDN